MMIMLSKRCRWGESDKRGICFYTSVLGDKIASETLILHRSTENYMC